MNKNDYSMHFVMKTFNNTSMDEAHVMIFMQVQTKKSHIVMNWIYVIVSINVDIRLIGK